MTGKHIIIGGGSGFIGQHLTKALRERGDRVTWVSRHAGAGRITWDQLRAEGLPACDAVINLAGQHILDLRYRWTRRYRDAVISSRMRTTRQLVDAINCSTAPPEVFISSAGKCYYGTRPLAAAESYPELDEYSKPMELDFPAELVGLWEAAADHLDRDRVRHVRLRIGIVLGALRRRTVWAGIVNLHRDRGALSAMRVVFSLGLGATLGHGYQPFPWVHIDDMVGLILHTLDHRQLRGRFNAVAPGIIDNREFTLAFARQVGARVHWSVPAWLVNLIVGKQRSSILLEGQLVRPKRTLASGFKFRYPRIDTALDDLTHILN